MTRALLIAVLLIPSLAWAETACKVDKATGKKVCVRTVDVSQDPPGTRYEVSAEVKDATGKVRDRFGPVTTGEGCSDMRIMPPVEGKLLIEVTCPLDWTQSISVIKK